MPSLASVLQGENLASPETALKMSMAIQEKNGPATDEAIKRFNLDSTVRGEIHRRSYCTTVVVQKTIVLHAVSLVENITAAGVGMCRHVFRSVFLRGSVPIACVQAAEGVLCPPPFSLVVGN